MKLNKNISRKEMKFKIVNHVKYHLIGFCFGNNGLHQGIKHIYNLTISFFF